MTPPAFPPAAIAAARDAAKAYLRVIGDEEDALIATFAASALAAGEAFTGTAWIAREWQEMLPVSRAWQALGVVPVTAIMAVEGLPAQGAAFALAAEAYAIDLDAEGIGWVRGIAPGSAARLRVTLSAGAAADWGSLPPPLAEGVVLAVAAMFEHREGEALPAAVTALWRPYRRMRLYAEARA